MSAPKRRSLRDRNAEAIAGPPVEVLEEKVQTVGERPQPEPPTTPEPATKPKAARAPKAKKATPKPSAATGAAPTVRLGIYFTPAEFDAAKAAYLVDWQHGGTADTFARWIAEALDTHAARTPAQRAELARPQERAARSSATRSFAIPAATLDRLRQAIVDDHTLDRWPSDSAWCVDAIAVAVDQARSKTGGTLPTPPPRLPNRLTR